jgi:outer membrane murein-binding lipoprotein Lpp
MSARRLIPLCLVAASAGAALAGCGTSADRDQARAAAQTLYAAAHRHDGATACAQMSPSLRAELVDDEQAACPKAVLDLDLHGRTAAVVRVYANNAEVRLAGGDTVFLGDTNEGWRVDALGCRPQGSGPYDCEATS